MLQKTNEGYQISLYKDNEATRDEIMTAMSRLSIAFPKMTKEFFVLLAEFIVKERFTGQRLSDAVNNLIATFQYKEINISDVIKFDKKLRIYTIAEVNDLVADKKANYEDFEPHFIDEKKYYVKLTDKLNRL